MSFTTTILRHRLALILAGVGIVVIAIAAYYLNMQSAKNTPDEETAVVTASTTDNNQVTSNEKKGLPPESTFSLPDGAVAIDEYAFRMAGGVFMRSLTGKNPLQILNADADSFERLANFSTYSSNGVTNDCGANPIYAYYGDNGHVYFYQIWRTSFFRTSQIEVVVDAEKENFEITGVHTATDGARQFEVAHMKTASSTCLLTLKRTDKK